MPSGEWPDSYAEGEHGAWGYFLTPADLLDELAAAVEEELLEVRASEAARRIPVHNGRCVGQAGSDWLYTFGLQYPMTLPDDVPLRIELSADETYTGQLVTATAFEVTLACSVRLPEKLSTANLTLNTSFLLEQLMLRLSEIEPDDCDLPMALFGFRQPKAAGKAPALDDPEANEFQLEALRAAIERDVTYVWGPPGTGKTTALALIAEALVGRGLRVLAVASTNVAVDNAILKVAERIGGDASVVRFGTPQLPALRDPLATPSGPRGSLMQTLPLPFDLPSPAAGKGQGGRTWRSTENHLHSPGGEGTVTVVPAKRLSDPKDEAARQRMLRQARVVGATLTRVALAPELASPGFDAVLLDEASASQLPAVFAAAALAGSKVVALGDPKQLPPVALSNGPLSRRWLQRDIFAQAGLEDEDDRAVLLREQYRMHPAISRLSNGLVYSGRLHDAPRLRLAAGGAYLVDTAGQSPRCERQDGSRVNRVHAEAAVSAAAKILSQGSTRANHDAPGVTMPSVAIIAPYRAQARLIWRLLRDARLDKSVDVGTVHRFQGLERKAIVFDTVEGPPERPAPFVSGGYGSEAMRLINVAITRAQSELVVIANVEYLCHMLRQGSTLLGLLALLSGE
ncbi:MAG TPA: AAA domain-containing protein [Chloroflexota bacterium]|nr:AAA domain-containing protein [Chloroflexota bacterium]